MEGNHHFAPNKISMDTVGFTMHLCYLSGVISGSVLFFSLLLFSIECWSVASHVNYYFFTLLFGWPCVST
jgi:hypothetical protein